MREEASSSFRKGDYPSPDATREAASRRPNRRFIRDKWRIHVEDRDSPRAHEANIQQPQDFSDDGNQLGEEEEDEGDRKKDDDDDDTGVDPAWKEEGGHREEWEEKKKTTTKVRDYQHRRLGADSLLRSDRPGSPGSGRGGAHRTTTTSTSSSSSSSSSTTSSSMPRLRRILSLLSTSNDQDFVENSHYLSMEVAAWMAVLDFNQQRRAEFLAFLNNHTSTALPHEASSSSSSSSSSSCNVYLSLDFRNAQFSPIVAGQEFEQELWLANSNNNQSSAGLQSHQLTNTSDPTLAWLPPDVSASLGAPTWWQATSLPPMAILGPYRSVESQIIATLGGVYAPAESFSSSATTDQLFSALAAEVGLPNISPSSTSSQLDNKEQYPYFARTIPTNRGDAEAMVQYWHHYNISRVGVLYSNDPYGTAFFLDVVNAAAKYALQIFPYTYTDSLSESIDSALAQIQAQSDVRYFFAILSGGLWRDVVLALFRRGLLGGSASATASSTQPLPNQKVWFFSESAQDAIDLVLPINNTNNIELAAAMDRAAMVVIHPTDTGMAQQQKQLEDFLANDTWVEAFLAHHITGPLSNLTRAELQQVFTPSVSVDSLMTYDAVIALGLAACHVDQDEFTGSQLYDSLMQIQFTGETGWVAFDANTGTREYSSVQYQIVNILPNYNISSGVITLTGVTSLIIQGQGDEATIQVVEPLQFPGGWGTTPPPSIPPAPVEDMNLIGYGVLTVCWLLASAAVVFGFFCIIWTRHHYSQPEVRASQPPFLIIAAAGAIMMGLSIIPGTLQEPISTRVLDVACNTQLWLLSLGFSISFSALFAKTWRINKLIGSSQRFRRVQIRVKESIMVGSVLTLINLAILIAWSIVDPLQRQRAVTESDAFGRPTSSVGSCLNLSSAQKAFPFTLVALDVTALASLNYISFRARNLPSEFNESVYVGLTNLILLEVVILGGPVLLILSDPASQTLVKSLLSATFSFGVLLPLFVPKFSRMRRRRSQGGSTTRPPSRRFVPSRPRDASSVRRLTVSTLSRRRSSSRPGAEVQGGPKSSPF